MTTFLAVAWLVTALGGGIAVWWYRRKALAETATAKVNEKAFKVERVLRKKAQDDARVLAESQAQLAVAANAMYNRLRDEDKKTVDEIVRTGDADRAADFLREAWSRASGSGGAEDRAVHGPEAPKPSAAGLIEDL